MELNQIMTQKVEFADINITLQEAARIMRDFNVGALPIRNGDRLAGIITDRDIVIRALADGADPAKSNVGVYMTSPVVYVYEDQKVHEAAQLMESKKIRRLPVLNRKKRLMGFVSLSDLAADPEEHKFVAEVLEHVSASA